jgi:hypothetical protein
MLKRFILWDYPRASWQYDVMVGIILAFVFLIPRDWFRDQPRIPRASNVAMLPSEQGAQVFWVDPELLAGLSEPQRIPRAAEILRKRTGARGLQVTRLEVIRDSESEIKGYMAFAQP